ncbi:MAG: hypothetical protein ABIO02_04185 [Patescibacteria group bacterium]
MITDKTRNLIKYYTSFWFYLILVLAFCLVVFYPRFSSTLFSFKREQSWSQYEQQIKQTKKMDPQAYWKFREFYNNGNFTYKPEGFDEKTVNAILKRMEVPVYADQINKTFLIYNSDKFTSIDALVTSQFLNQIIDPKNVQLVTYNSGDNYFILKNSNKYVLVFILPVSEMQKANGYIEYREPSVQKELEGKYWLNISEIKI